MHKLWDFLAQNRINVVDFDLKMGKYRENRQEFNYINSILCQKLGIYCLLPIKVPRLRC